MFENLTVFKTASAMARHAGQSQALIAQNVANANTPNYVGRQVAPFASLYAPSEGGTTQRATRGGHLNGSVEGQEWAKTEIRNGENPNQNTISLEAELLRSAEAKTDHDRALAIYKSALDVLRMAVRTN
ncbi:FlgB family protein [Sulfitobacter donghicola]|uniref:Flagellar basal-body rod protein FlgB n=1 Tax=Sulfitobacter donghicola DSW-25 = KCTC 12864 = JCM 14565 TaxID=1300350 RepID=A0A073IM57_9RHOB|nr:FlgB family protein [Sulfitobacter donghicola]KEJ90556.1 flagellar basal-body rod protein FlgB [Sulfitobacter donghicola DSW-25 = KCTC 12864 = JCM 14565]